MQQTYYRNTITNSIRSYDQYINDFEKLFPDECPVTAILRLIDSGILEIVFDDNLMFVEVV